MSVAAQRLSTHAFRSQTEPDSVLEGLTQEQNTVLFELSAINLSLIHLFVAFFRSHLARDIFL